MSKLRDLICPLDRSMEGHCNCRAGVKGDIDGSKRFDRSIAGSVKARFGMRHGAASNKSEALLKSLARGPAQDGSDRDQNLRLDPIFCTRRRHYVANPYIHAAVLHGSRCSHAESKSAQSLGLRYHGLPAALLQESAIRRATSTAAFVVQGLQNKIQMSSSLLKVLCATSKQSSRQFRRPFHGFESCPALQGPAFRRLSRHRLRERPSLLSSPWFRIYAERDTKRDEG